jgi:hypothetical protein
VHEIEVRRPVGLNGVDLVFVFYFSLQPFHPPSRIAGLRRTGSLRPSRYGAVVDLVAEARLLAFELMPMCANIKNRPVSVSESSTAFQHAALW